MDEANTKTHRWHLMCYFAAQLEPFPVLKLQFDIENLPYLGFTEAIDITAALGQIGDARRMFTAVSIPNGVETNFQSLFTSAVAHMLSGRVSGRWQG